MTTPRPFRANMGSAGPEPSMGWALVSWGCHSQTSQAKDFSNGCLCPHSSGGWKSRSRYPHIRFWWGLSSRLADGPSRCVIMWPFLPAWREPESGSKPYKVTNPLGLGHHISPCVLSRCSSIQLCPMDCSPPGSSVHGVPQARILEWVAISSSRESSWPRDWTPISYVSCIGRQILYH